MGESARRVLLKISGEALSADGQSLSSKALVRLAEELAEAARGPVQIALVVGGGNLVRGRELRGAPIPAHIADTMGMLGTVINGLALTSAIEAAGGAARVYSAIGIGGAVPPFSVRVCDSDLRAGRVVVLAGGTGNPFFTTDSCASLRAAELGAEILLKGTKVDGVYSADPQKDASARLYDRLTYSQVLRERLEVMDATAIAMCMDRQLPIRVFNMMQPGNIGRALAGEALGTLVCPEGFPQVEEREA